MLPFTLALEDASVAAWPLERQVVVLRIQIAAEVLEVTARCARARAGAARVRSVAAARGRELLPPADSLS